MFIEGVKSLGDTLEGGRKSLRYSERWVKKFQRTKIKIFQAPTKVFDSGSTSSNSLGWGIGLITALAITQTQFYEFLVMRDCSQKGADAKTGALKICDPCKGGALKKNTTNFPVKNEFTCFSMGLTRNFHGAVKFFEA